MQRGQATDEAVPSVQSWLRDAYMASRLVDPLTSARPKAEIIALGSLPHQHIHMIEETGPRRHEQGQRVLVLSGVLLTSATLEAGIGAVQSLPQKQTLAVLLNTHMSAVLMRWAA